MVDSTAITATDMFCGAGGSSLGAHHEGIEVHLAINHWTLAVETHNTNFPKTLHDCADISATNPRRYPSTTILMASPECFPAGTLILTSNGLKPIEAVKVGDMVLTHRGRWRPVTSLMQKTAPTVIVQGRGHYGLEMTAAHPVWARERVKEWDNLNRRWAHVLRDEEWVDAERLAEKDYYWSSPSSFGDALPIPAPGGRGAEPTPEFWWMVGRWLGDGNLRIRGGGGKGDSLFISCSYAEAERVHERLSFAEPAGSRAQAGEYRWHRRDQRTAVVFSCAHNGLVQWLRANFGEYAHGKRLPAWVVTMPRTWREFLLDGYITADGHFGERNICTSTVSRELAIGIRLLALSLGHHATLHTTQRKLRTIEGRRVNQRRIYMVHWLMEPKRQIAHDTDAHVWGSVNSVKPGRKSVTVYNLSVAEDESYTADGIVVHNCTNHTIAKGKKRVSGQMELLPNGEIDPAAERSRATMWDVPRFAEHHQYEIVIVENVVEARKWAPFDAWLHAMSSLGYDHKVVYLNSMFFPPTPQSRDRMYVVFWRKGNQAPDLDYRPPAYCPKCEENIEAVQSWNNPHKPWGKWGRYRFQYVYRCPACAEEVVPYYYCAANAVDWSNLGERIGDRKHPLKPKTLRRIEMGLKKYGQQSLLIQTAYTHAKGDRSSRMTDPVPTQSTCQTVGLLATPAPWLASVNYFKPDRGADEPWPTQTTGEHYGLLSPAPFLLGYANGTSAPFGVERPLLTQHTSIGHALITPAPFMVGHYSPGWSRSLDEPTGSVTATDHHSLVAPPFVVQLRNNQNAQGIDEALSTVTATGSHHALLSPMPFVASYYGSGGQLNDLGQPLATVTAVDKHALVMPTEPPKLEDCHFRMFQPHEIGAAMAFPSTYVVLGTKRDQTKQYGNAVTPPAMRYLARQAVASLT